LTFETFILFLWLQYCSAFYRVEPEFVKAVADIESGVSQGFKTGAIDKRGKYIAPMGIYYKCAPGYNKHDPFVNIALGARALGRFKDKKRALKKYNTAYNDKYYKTIITKYKYYKQKGLQ